MTTATTLARQFETIYVLLEDGTRRALAPIGLTPTQYHLLDLLDDAAREGISITALAARLLCTRGNASRLVGRLAEAGLVGTGSVSTDDRIVLARLTRAGRERLAEAREALAAADELRFAGLDEPGRAELAATLEQLRGELADTLQNS